MNKTLIVGKCFLVVQLIMVQIADGDEIWKHDITLRPVRSSYAWPGGYCQPGTASADFVGGTMEAWKA